MVLILHIRCLHRALTISPFAQINLNAQELATAMASVLVPMLGGITLVAALATVSKVIRVAVLVADPATRLTAVAQAPVVSRVAVQEIVREIVPVVALEITQVTVRAIVRVTAVARATILVLAQETAQETARITAQEIAKDSCKV